MKNLKQSSEAMAELASKVLHSRKASAIKKSLAASVLAQRHTTKETGKQMEIIASKVLHSKRYSEETKSLAASVLAQANKPR
jgi:hypothetical protein